jgi:hypothetical protein
MTTSDPDEFVTRLYRSFGLHFYVSPTWLAHERGYDVVYAQAAALRPVQGNRLYVDATPSGSEGQQRTMGGRVARAFAEGLLLERGQGIPHREDVQRLACAIAIPRHLMNGRGADPDLFVHAPLQWLVDLAAKMPSRTRRDSAFDKR